MAVMIEDALTCQDCGTREEEWDPKRGGEIDAYYAHSRICEGCKRTQEKSAALAEEAKQYGASLLEGVKINLMPKLEYQALMEKKRQTEMERRQLRRDRGVE